MASDRPTSFCRCRLSITSEPPGLEDRWAVGGKKFVQLIGVGRFLTNCLNSAVNRLFVLPVGDGRTGTLVSFVLSGPKSLEKPTDSTELSLFSWERLAPRRGACRVGGVFPVLNCGIICLALAAISAAEDGASGRSVYQRNGVAAKAEQTLAGQPERIVAAMLAELGRADSISARLRQRTRVGDRVLVGTGRYLQQGRGGDQRFRFETVTRADDVTFELLELSDGLSFWKFQRNGDDSPRLERVDISRVCAKLEESGSLASGVVSIHLGGLQRSLATVRQWFRFQTAEAATLEGLPVWRVKGKWSPTLLAGILPSQAEAVRSPKGILPGQLPEGMPWSVELVIGSQQLFPFRVEWQAVLGDRPVGASLVPEAYSVLELYDVRLNEPVDSAAFVYRPGDQGLIDVTETFLEQTGPLRP